MPHHPHRCIFKQSFLLLRLWKNDKCMSALPWWMFFRVDLLSYSPWFTSPAFECVKCGIRLASSNRKLQDMVAMEFVFAAFYLLSLCQKTQVMSVVSELVVGQPYGVGGVSEMKRTAMSHGIALTYASEYLVH